MFSSKKTTLFDVKSTSVKSSGNSFVRTRTMKSSETRSGNGSLKYTTTGNDFVDQFGKMGEYRNPRTWEQIDLDMRLLWSQDKGMALRFTLFTRMITRKVSFDGQTTANVQRGQGLKHEGITRLMWIAVNDPAVFYNNIALIPAVGSWKDIFVMLQTDLVYNGWEGRKLDWNKLFNLIHLGLSTDSQSELVKKYLPQIKSRAICKTVESQADCMIGKWIASQIQANNTDTYKTYRKLKTSGTAHEWQKAISRRDYNSLDFGTVHGRALAILTGGKFLDNQKLTAKYVNWLDGQDTVKFTGYPYELMNGLSATTPLHKKITIDKQWKTLVETAKDGKPMDTSFIVVGDTSASMNAEATGTKVTSYHAMKSLALFFSEMLSGHFANSWIEFNKSAIMHTWKGNTPTEKFLNMRNSIVGDTNFLNVANLFASIKESGVAETDFPTGIICISDGEFNSNANWPGRDMVTVFAEFLSSLRRAGFSEEFVANFKIVLWDIRNNYYGTKHKSGFESFADAPNLFYMSGLDGSTVSFLLGGEEVTSIGEVVEKVAPKTAEELFAAAMDQEIFNQIQL